MIKKMNKKEYISMKARGWNIKIIKADDNEVIGRLEYEKGNYK